MTASVGVHFSLGIGVDADSTDDVIRLTQDGPHIELRGCHPPCIRSVPLKAHSSQSYRARLTNADFAPFADLFKQPYRKNRLQIGAATARRKGGSRRGMQAEAC